MKKEPYTTRCEVSNPGLIVIIGDSSHSMIGEKNRLLNDSINYFINDLCMKNHDGYGYKDLVYLCCIEYGGCGGDSAKIIRQGKLSEFGNNPIGSTIIKKQKKNIVNGDLVSIDVNEIHTFINYNAKGATATSNAFYLAIDYINNYAAKYPNAPAPIVLHFTDSHPYSNRFRYGEKYRSIKAATLLTTTGTSDGSTILFNIQITSDDKNNTDNESGAGSSSDEKNNIQYIFPEQDTYIEGNSNQIMESMSTVIPQPYIANARRYGMNLGKRPMSFATNIDASQILKFIQFGSSSMIDRMS